VWFVQNHCWDLRHGYDHLLRYTKTTRIYRSESARLDRRRWCKDSVNRTGITVGERVLRKLQRPLPRRIAERWVVLHLARGSDPDRAMAHPL